MKAREADLVETFEWLIFDVKGLVHPSNRVIAFIRYFPDEKGDRRRRGAVVYGKVYSLSERYSLLKERFPRYLIYDSVFDETLSEVSAKDVKRHYVPVERLRELRKSRRLDALERRALQLAELVKQNANIKWNAIGISGSILAELHKSTSDIDPIIYGSKSCWRVYSALRNMLKDEQGPFKPYSSMDLKTLFDFRSKDTEMSYENFVRTESRKLLQGKFMGIDYFIRFVKDWGEVDENYGDVRYKNVGYAKIEARVVDDSEAIFTPCTYKIEGAKTLEGSKSQTIKEIVSFRGRFCEQAKTGETVVAQGKVERVTDCRQDHEHFRLLVGNKPSDHMFVK
jgi:hypothetical protein